MLLIEKIDALLNGVTRQDVEHLRPAQRERLAFLLRAVADMCEPPVKSIPKEGVLARLREGERGHG